MSVEVIGSGPRMDAMREEWTELYDRVGGGNVFLSHPWLRHWLAHFGTTSHRVLLCRRKGVLTGAMATDLRGERAHVLGDHTYWSGALAEDPGSLLELCDGLRHIGAQRIELVGPETTAYGRWLDRACRRRYVAVPKHGYISRAIPVLPTLEAYLETRKPKPRAEIRRKLRKLARERPGATLETWNHRSFDETAIAIVDQVERESWKRDNGTAIVCSQREVAFYNGLMRLDAPALRPHLFALMQGGEPLAYMMGLSHGDAFYALKTSYPMAMRHLSPGIVLFCEVLTVLGADGEARRIELLGRDSRFKQELSSEARGWCTYELRRATLSARSYELYRRRVRPWLAGVATNTPAGRQAATWLATALGGARRLRPARPDEPASDGAAKAPAAIEAIGSRRAATASLAS